VQRKSPALTSSLLKYKSLQVSRSSSWVLRKNTSTEGDLPFNVVSLPKMLLLDSSLTPERLRYTDLLVVTVSDWTQAQDMQVPRLL
jgi:hypothetical protein